MPRDLYQVPRFLQCVTRCSDKVHRSSESTWVDCLSASVDPSRGMAPSAYLRVSAQMALAHSRVLRRRIEANPPTKELVPESHDGDGACDWCVVVPRLERRGTGRPTRNWRFPPITPIRGMAPSTYRRISGKWRWRQFPDRAPLNSANRSGRCGGRCGCARTK
jgi:hypothetical protein